MDSHSATPQKNRHAIPSTSRALEMDETRPYFLWWTNCTVGQLRAHLRDANEQQRGYWLGALLREANSRDVWLYTNPDELRRSWPYVVRHLGRSRAMWAWLLDIEDFAWPPAEASRA